MNKISPPTKLFKHTTRQISCYSPVRWSTACLVGVAIATSSVQYREGGASTASLSSPPRLQSPEVVHGAMDLIIFPSIFIMLIFLTCGTLYLIA